MGFESRLFKISKEENARNHLERILSLSNSNEYGKYFLESDRRILREGISSLKSTPTNRVSDIRWYAKRILKQARHLRDSGKVEFLVDGDFYDLEGLKGLVYRIKRESKNYFDRKTNWFMQSILNLPASALLSVKQTAWIKSIKRKFEGVVVPHRNGEIFSIDFYDGNIGRRGLSSDDAYRLLCFAVNGKMTGGLGGGKNKALEVVRDKYWNGKDLDSLRDELGKYVEEKGLIVGMGRYNPIISDLERYFSVQDKKRQ